jgi:hypothetical protein
MSRNLLDLSKVQPARLRDVVRMIGAELDLDALLETGIAVLSLAAIVMLVSGGSWHRWGSVVGLASQPFWIFATWRARRWGMFVVSCAYVFVWVFGIGTGFPRLF